MSMSGIDSEPGQGRGCDCQENVVTRGSGHPQSTRVEAWQSL